MKTTRNPQLNLKLDAAAPDPSNRWHDGATMHCLGAPLTLRVGTEHKDATVEKTAGGDVLHLPLPPQATPRQIQDRAEAWLREEAKRVFGELIRQKSALAGRRAPRLALSFSTKGHWVEVLGADALRCNWHLIEQPMAAIEQAIGRAVAALPPEDRGFDLFGAALA